MSLDEARDYMELIIARTETPSSHPTSYESLDPADTPQDPEEQPEDFHQHNE